MEANPETGELLQKLMEGATDMRITKGISPEARAEQDNAAAMAQRNADLIEYIAMMANVEIPTEDVEENHEQEI